MTNDELHGIFFAECEEALAAAEAGLSACRDNGGDKDTINSVFRAVHSVKGGAGAFGFVALQQFAHHFETLLSEAREGRLALDGPALALMLRAVDILSDHISVAQTGEAAPDDGECVEAMQAFLSGGSGSDAAPAETPAAEAEPAFDEEEADPAGPDDALLDSLLDDLCAPAPAAPEEAAPEAEWLFSFRPHAGAMEHGTEPLLMLRELQGMGGRLVDTEIGAVPPLEDLIPGAGYLGWTFAFPASVSEADVREVFDFVGDDIAIACNSDQIPPLRLPQPAPRAQAATPVAAAPPVPAAAAAVAANDAPQAAAPVPQTIRIDLKKLDRLIDAVGELTIAQAVLAQRFMSSGNREGTEELAMLDSLTRDIQESAMAIRAQPIGTVFSRVPRLLRDLAAETGKHVKLELNGESTEVDKTVIERLSEPLTHLIRNAVDHGIEPPEERLEAGKPPEGVVRLSAEQRSGRIVITISDDGRGIDRVRVLEKAKAQGLVDPNAELSGEEIDMLIFAAGFSTAKVVSNVSGRGVGMDVVRENVKELGGRITIESNHGVGTIFTLALPLTLAIAEGMIIRDGMDTFVLPLANVVESLRPTPEMVQGMGRDRELLNMRGRMVPVVRLGRLSSAESDRQLTESVVIVVDTEAGGRAALLVDEIMDQRQVVIKSVEQNVGNVTGVSGATILGDGQVALILDVEAIVAGEAHFNRRLAEAA